MIQNPIMTYVYPLYALVHDHATVNGIKKMFSDAVILVFEGRTLIELSGYEWKQI